MPINERDEVTRVGTFGAEKRRLASRGVRAEVIVVVVAVACAVAALVAIVRC